MTIDDHRASRLRRDNLVMAVLHAAQGVAVVVLANDFTLPVTASFLEGPPGTDPAAPTTVFDLDVAWGVAVFLFLSAAFHLLAGVVLFDRYRDQLARGQNQLRWIEYSLSASVMIVLIAMLTGISDLAALVALFGVNAGMIMFGAVQERYERPGGSLWPFWLGCVLGIVPWLAIGFYLVSPGSAADAPGFVYGIFVSLFLFFNSFALVQWLQYREVGRWSDYLVGERSYIVLSLVAKSALAWQVFAGTLAG
ncbi:heliorhodopsin HeR [Nitriliruptoria bacterium AS10]|nr:heliorhodopsin HeR [Salsipaludibacter albus]